MITSNSEKYSFVNQVAIIGSTITPTPLTASVEAGSSTIVLSATPATPILIGAEVDITGWSQFGTTVTSISGTTLTLSLINH